LAFTKTKGAYAGSVDNNPRGFGLKEVIISGLSYPRNSPNNGYFLNCGFAIAYGMASIGEPHNSMLSTPTVAFHQPTPTIYLVRHHA